MAPVWVAAVYRFSSEWRHRWRSLLWTALLVGMATGAAIGAYAGARRTASVFDRMRAATKSWDMLVLPETPGAMDALSSERIAAIPGVRRVATGVGLVALLPDGSPFSGLSLVPVDGSLGNTMGRPLLRAGRYPDQEAPDEVLASAQALRDLGVSVGDSFELYIVPQVDVRNLGEYAPQLQADVLAGKLGERRTFHVTGEGIDIGEVSQPFISSLLFTKALWDEAHPGPMFAGYALALANGDAGVPAVEATVTALASGEQVSFQTTQSARAAATRTLDPQVLALRVFAAVLALAALLLWSAAVRRQMRRDATDDHVLAGIGLSRAGSAAVDVLRTLAVVVPAIPIAFTVGAAVSVFMPRNEAYNWEPHRGLDVDPAAFLLALLLVPATLALALAARALSGRIRSRHGRPLVLHRPLPGPAVSTGVAGALQNSGGRRAAWSLGGAVLAVLAVVATLSFSVGLDRLVSTPSAYGWGFDAYVPIGGTGADEASMAVRAAAPTLDADSEVRGWGTGLVVQAAVDGQSENLMGIGQRGGRPVNPTIVSGRAPAAADEVAVGERTLRLLGKSIGDEVAVGAGASAASFRLVGTAVLPYLGSNSGDAAVLGGGALLTLDGLHAAIGLGEDAVGDSLVIDLAPHARPADLQARLRSVLAVAGVPGGSSVDVIGPTAEPRVDTPTEPLEVRAYRHLRGTPLVLAGLLGLLAAGAVGQGLTAAIRGRRREFGVLRSLGFTSAQVRASAAAQASTVGLLAVAVGIPAGLLLGRLLWHDLVRQIGVVDTGMFSWQVIAGVGAAVVLIAVVLAFPAGGRAARRQPAEALRDE